MTTPVNIKITVSIINLYMILIIWSAGGAAAKSTPTAAGVLFVGDTNGWSCSPEGSQWRTYPLQRSDSVMTVRVVRPAGPAASSRRGRQRLEHQEPLLHQLGCAKLTQHQLTEPDFGYS